MPSMAQNLTDDPPTKREAEAKKKIKDAAKKARSGGGPTIIEAVTFRMRGHEEASGVKYIPNKLLTPELSGLSENLISFPESVTALLTVLKISSSLSIILIACPLIFE